MCLLSPHIGPLTYTLIRAEVFISTPKSPMRQTLFVCVNVMTGIGSGRTTWRYLAARGSLVCASTMRFAVAVASRRSARSTIVELLADAERAEDQIEDVIRRCGPGDRIQGTQGIVEIEQQHFMRDFISDSYFGRS